MLSARSCSTAFLVVMARSMAGRVAGVERPQSASPQQASKLGAHVCLRQAFDPSHPGFSHPADAVCAKLTCLLQKHHHRITDGPLPRPIHCHHPVLHLL
uniref:Uncharacterized protein n=1 Tax=Candidatus Kentrum eta TaxID=2126337 RepID=A0A450UFD1_9GAMM|nr:MAG: hypothetical protein BECKH772A_GA0070896_1001438 [Candidatus Kentron sp. H]VFJ91162.1 MAG: hypothetical protein BECKH772B_GA0070898_1001438 [Candidatus Kentron sp. H]VFJ97510.1 MAG: hypothetical protein BECKH772C_GA0070978_1001338 [Candidatus Kentron sp. H]